MYSACFLKSIRNDLPLEFTLSQLAEQAPYSKFIEGFLRFECPHCHQHRATVNPKNNLAHCFCCQRNINNIDLMIELGYGFKQAVSILENWLHRYKTSLENAKNRNQSGIKTGLYCRGTMHRAHTITKLEDNLVKVIYKEP